MVVQSHEPDNKQSLLDLLGGKTKAKGNGSKDLFSTLLSALANQHKGDVKTVSSASEGFKAIIDPKKSGKAAELQMLLGTDTETDENALISKELLSALSDEQVRTLIHRAKEQLKNQIASKSPEYQNDAKPLPKTLGGLIQLAEKLGLEPQSVTLSALMDDTAEKNDLPAQLLSQPLLDAKAVAQLPAPAQEATSAETLSLLLADRKANSAKPSVSEDGNVEADQKTSERQPLKTLLQAIEAKTEPAADALASEGEKPLETKTAAPKADSLIALLQGETQTKETKHDDSGSGKVDAATEKAQLLPKADSLEVKSKEAQQSMRVFATDLKEAVENYKPPFTRLTMKLNPEKLGEVEVTLVQRGNNVHINIQSANQNSVAFLAHNATELKAQLAHQGITNATMNFMAGGEGQAQQQQQQQNNHNRFRAYQSFEELELNEEQLGALEIIIPHYA